MPSASTLCCTKKGNNDDKKENFFCNLLSEYSENTTIHGIPYFTDSKRTWVERIWWIIGFVLSVTVCIYLISKTWIKWKENPVIVSFAQEHTPIWEIPFPAVTICPLNKINQDQFNYTEFYHILIFKLLPETITDSNLLSWEEKLTEGIKTFWDISLICNLDHSNYPQALKQNKEEITKLIKKLAPKMNETIREVLWQNENFANQESKQYLFHEQVTSEGLCFTFNALGHNDMYTDQIQPGLRFITHDKKSTGWTIEDGYSNNNFANSYPERTSQAGITFGLSTELIISAFQREGYCGDPVSGFKVLLHNPAELPRLAEQYFLAPAKQQVTVAITPKLIRTSKKLVSIPPQTRNCFFAKEKKLRFFKIYTQYNCKTECQANITRQHCGCLPFYLPRDKDTKVCGTESLQCLSEVNNLVFKYENIVRTHKITINEKEKKELKIFQACNCLASCDTLEYEVELSQAEYLFSLSRTAVNQSLNSSIVEVTPMNIFFKESQFLALDRSELYGQTDFIANIGGLLGLFMGFSFLSFLEIVYFLTLRMWCKLYNERKNGKLRPSILPAKPKIVWQIEMRK